MAKPSTTSLPAWQEAAFDGRLSSKVDSLQPQSANRPTKDLPSSSIELQVAQANTTIRPSTPLSNTAPSSPTSPSSINSAEETKDYIIFLENGPGSGDVGKRALALLRSLGESGQPRLIYEQLGGFVVTISDTQARRLQALNGVESVEADTAVSMQLPIQLPPQAGTSPIDAITGQALPMVANSTATSGETLPWGVAAVWNGVDISKSGNIGSSKTAFVIDSGISTKTTDLNVNTLWSKSWITGEDAFTDGLGHGTHVSGTIGALANGYGVVGVAPGAQIISLKVFNSSGGGATYSSIIDAINFALGKVKNNGLSKPDVVVNMSLGGGFSSSLDTAVKNAAIQGLRCAIAAGNDSKDADGYSPAAAGDHPDVFTVSAVDNSYRMPKFSNWDKITATDKVDDVDIAAPGVSVLSYNGSTGGLEYWSGTSMATPHAAGLLLMGGIKAGDLVTPYFSGTADPFALAASPPLII